MGAIHPGARKPRGASRVGGSSPLPPATTSANCKGLYFQQPQAKIPPSAVDRQRDELILAHQELLVAIARRCHRSLPYWRDLDELVAEGQIGLIEAATKFDPARGIPFSAYARPRIRGAIIDAFRRRNYDWELHAELKPDDCPAAVSGEPQLPGPVQKTQAAAVLQRAMGVLSVAERNVIRAALRGETLKDYGQRIGVTESFACLVRQSAEQKLRGVLEACGHSTRTLAT